jgi:DNA repair protein RadC
VRVGELFKPAVRSNAAGIIVIHNHPSGDPTPSPDDIALTRAIVQAGKLLDVEVLDHLVIGRGRFVSLKERGLGFG